MTDGTKLGERASRLTAVLEDLGSQDADDALGLARAERVNGHVE